MGRGLQRGRLQIGESADHFRFNVEGQDVSCNVDVLAPADHSVVPASGVTLKWKAHPLADHYTLNAVNADGDIVATNGSRYFTVK